jgi:Tol biopolymer transport system component
MEAKILKSLVIVIVTILLINPVILFIITESPVVSFVIVLVTVFIICALQLRSTLKFLTPYFISLLAAVSILIHAEAIFITVYDDYKIEDLYLASDHYYFNRPFLNKTFKDKEYLVNYVTSKQGFRIGKEDNADVVVKECDWLFLGDSFTQGAQVEYEELYTTIIYKNFPDKVIVNSGISGWGIPEEFYYYKSEGNKLKPKKVFLQICNFNDFMNVTEKEASFSDFLMNHSEFLRFLLYPYKYSNPAELPLGRWTEPFYPTLEGNQDFNVFYKSKSPHQSMGLERFAQFLVELNEAVKQSGAELIVFQIPTKEQLYYRYFEEVVTAFNIEPSDLDMTYPNKFLSDLCSSNSIQYLDLMESLGARNEEVFFQYDEHLNVAGHIRLAEILTEFIKEDVVPGQKTKVEILSEHNSEDRYPIFYDPNLVTFQSMRDSNIELFIGDSLLGNVKRLTFNDVDELHPWLNESQNRVFFTEGNQEAGTTKVGSMQLDGSKRTYLTGPNYFGAIPALNPSRTRIAFPEWTMNEFGQFTNPTIVIADLESYGKISITSDNYESWRPVFSANDSSIFYISKRESGNYDIYQYDFATRTETNLTNSPFDEWDPFVSPEGRNLVYAGFKENNWDIFLLDVKSRKITQLTRTLGNEWDTTFSPDGRHIYYAGVYGFMNGIFRLKI